MQSKSGSPWARRFMPLVLCGLLTGCAPPWITPPGMVLLTLEVQHAGEVVLTTLFDAPDGSTTSELWDAAGRAPFATQSMSTSLSATRTDPLEVELTGPVEIRITHNVRGATTAALAGLRLSRSSPDTDDWHLPPAEVSRAKKAAGI